MLVANDSAGERVEATRRTPPGRYTCPGCGSSVIAKPGRVKIPHFAHAVSSDCPSAGESISHLAAKHLLAERFRAHGYQVDLEEPHGRDRRIDLAITLPHPSRPMRYAVEVQNSAIDVREMFRRFISDLEAGFWWTAWIFTGLHAAPLLRTPEGGETRLTADLLAAHHPLVPATSPEDHRRLAAIHGGNLGGWISDRYTDCPGSIYQLHGTKCLDDNGHLWSMHFGEATRRNARTGTSKILTSTKRIDRIRATSFDLFGPVWGEGDAQRRDLALALATHLPNDDTSPADFDTIADLAARVLQHPRNRDLDNWVTTTINHIIGRSPPGVSITPRMLKSTSQIYSYDWDDPLRAAPNGWPALPDRRRPRAARGQRAGAPAERPASPGASSGSSR
ncbi:competence protein CoiA [Amycolatopsis arida]|uniref:competence protein CoiA n=1 Tax=Amycolatopsis arida TaxID=587909 RepID=UPI001066F714|nr:competence protein CoiA family protein [Amycolatopsis arida]TDX84933.1 competence protein CoiA-like protein [Amycolatopsis arida]